jgi:hypothetical protein
MLAPSMASPLAQSVLELATRAGEGGVAMGTIVDALERDGFAAEEVEREIWSLLERRRLTPCGFVCRTIRRRADDGGSLRARVYEFLLVPWSAEMDQQLELGLDGPP